MKTKGIIIINKDFSREWLDLLLKSGFNTVGLHSLYQYGGVEGHLNWWVQEETQNLIAEFEKNGIIIEHQLHAVDWLLPRSLFESHPEWFRVNDKGERVKDWNLCVSNKEALKLVENSAYKLALILNQKSHNYYIWSDDCLNSICYCKDCQALSGADQSMIITNAILRGLKRYDKDARLSFLAYQDSLTVPTIAPEKDVFLEFAPIDRNHFKPICGDDEANVKVRKIFEGLTKVFPIETTQILEYFLDVSLYCKWKKEDATALNLDKTRLQSDLEWYASQGVSGITTFAGFIDKEWREKYGDGDILLYGDLLNKALK